MNITNEDEEWLQEFYPELNLKQTQTAKVVEGTLKFRAAFDRKNKKYIIDPDENSYAGDQLIEGEYEIRITFEDGGNFFREVQELGGKIKETAKQRGVVDLTDVHFYSESNKVCLVGYFDEDLSIPFKEFIDRPVLQFFYDQSYFRIYGEWPRSFYAHGILGVLENLNYKNTKNALPKIDRILLELRAMEQKDPTGYATLKKCCSKKKNNKGWHCLNTKKCPGTRMFDCHEKAFSGLITLKRMLKKTKMKL